jgi:lipopolysaccharide transport system ATP-binding protein
MALPIISVESVSKKFVISHESAEKYTTLRDTIVKKGKKLLRKSNEEGAHSKEEFWALNDVSFEIKQGERNGAGKSTLLKVLSRITEPTSGRITIRGRVASLLEVGTGFHPELTGRENIFLNGAILGMSRSEIRKKFDEIVAFAEVEKFLDTPVKRYSSGMYVRLAFAVAAHLEPEILIVDEVLAVGDAQFQKKCLGKMEAVSKNEGRTVLFVSHNMGVVNQLCQNAILMQNGRSISYGDVNSVIQDYLSVNSANAKGYEADEIKKKTKSNYISKFYTLNSKGDPCSEFVFDDSVHLEVEFVVNEQNPNLQIGIGLQDKVQNRIFTILQEVSKFTQVSPSVYRGVVKLPSSIIAPNLYSFTVALWTKDGVLYDALENSGSIKVYDSGTEFAKYEGVDYGSVIVKPEWL